MKKHSWFQWMAMAIVVPALALANGCGNRSKSLDEEQAPAGEPSSSSSSSTTSSSSTSGSSSSGGSDSSSSGGSSSTSSTSSSSTSSSGGSSSGGIGSLSGVYISGKIEAGFFGALNIDRIRITADGAGGAQWQSLLNPTESGEFTYAIAGDRTVAVDGDDRGIISQSGSYFTLAETDFGDGLSMEYNLRTSSGISTGTFQGEYVTGQLEVRHGNVTSGLILVRADGQGGLTVSGFDGKDDVEEFGYALQEDGILAIQKDAEDEYTQEGLLGLNGNAFVWVAEADDAVLRAGIRRSSGIGTAVLRGTYMVCMIGRSGGTTATARMSMVFDGTGQFTAGVIERSNFSIDGESSQYSVASDGTLYVNGDLAGIVSADGNLFMRADDFFMIGIRQE